MIETDFIESLRKQAAAVKEKEISFEWGSFITNIRGLLLETAKKGETRFKYPFEHQDNIARAKTYLEQHGFTVGTYSGSSGRGIMIDF